jgi:plastocyanin
MTGTSPGLAAATLIPFVLLVAAGCGGGGAPSPTPAEPPAGGAAERPAPPPPPPAAPAAAAAAGSAKIAGTVRYDGDVPKLPAVDMGADPGCAKKHPTSVQSEVLVLGQGNTMANVFVHVKGGLAGGAHPVPAEPAVIDQDGCRYAPHVLGAMVGQTVKILNSDGLLHNVHALPEVNKTFNMAMPASRTEAEVVFDKAEFMFKIKCDVHPWMGAWMSVLSHPYFAVTGADGTFEIAGLPAGSYEVEAWHERLGTRTATVEVADGGTGSAEFTFSK